MVRHCIRCQKSFAQFSGEYSSLCVRCNKRFNKRMADAFVKVATRMIEMGEGDKVIAFMNKAEERYG